MKAHIPNTSHFSYISIGALCLLTIATSVFVGVASSSGEIASFDNSASDMADELKLFQQMPLVITAARKPQSTTEAPATIDVITAENIRRSGALTLTELLEQLPGIYTPTAHNALDMLWIRGVGGRFNDNALLLIDGVPYRTLYFSNFPINEQIPLEDIQRIEVVRGPGSALYGTNAFTGVINILTKDTADIESNEVSVSYGSWNTQNHYLLAGKQFKNAEVNLFAKYLDSDGYKVGQDDEGNSTDERRGAHNDAYKLKLKYNNLDLSLRYSKFTLNDFTSVPGDEEGGESIREHLLSRLGYHRDFGRRLSLQFTAYLNIYNLDKSRMAFDEDLSLTWFNETQYYGRVAGIDILSTIDFSENHTLLFGVNYEYEYLDRAWNRTRESLADAFKFVDWATASGGEEPESIDNNNWGVYLEDEFKLGEKLILTGGLRFDAFEASESRFSPRVSTILTPDKNTTIKLRYGEAFRAPTYQELYRQAEDDEGEGSLNLDPQIIRTAEFEVSRFIADNHRLNTTFFYTAFERFIKVMGDGDFENLGERNFYGVEIALNGRLSKDLSYFSNYSFTKGKQDETDIGGLPENMGNIGLTFTGLKYVDIVPHLRFVGNRNRPENYQEDVEEINHQNLLGGYGILNLTVLFKDLPGPLRTSVSIRNLLDEAYYTPGEKTEDFDIKQPGQRIIFTSSLDF